MNAERINEAVKQLARSREAYNRAVEHAVLLGVQVEIFLPDIPKYVAKANVNHPKLCRPLSHRCTIEIAEGTEIL